MTTKNSLAPLTILPPNKTVVFYSPIEGRDVLVRTGVLNDPESFVHALLHAHSAEYVKENEDGRCDLVEKMMKNLNQHLQGRKWDDFSSSISIQVPFQDNVKDLLVDFYRVIQKSRSPKASKSVCKNILKRSNDLDTFQIICEIVSLEQVKNALSNAFSSFGDSKISVYRNLVLENLHNLALSSFKNLQPELDLKRVSFCLNKFNLLINEVLTTAEKTVQKNNNTDIKNLTVDSATVEAFSERLNRDIYFLDSHTRLPYCPVQVEPKKRKSIILIWLGGSHYEVVGKLLDENRIQREFYNEDPLIKRISTFLYHPETVADAYPNLIPYLPREEREKIGFFDRSVSKSEDEKEQSSESSSSESSSSETEEEPEEEEQHSSPKKERRRKLKRK